MRIGILGGTFDPIHIAHLALAEQAVQQLALDTVLFVPAWQAPHKTGDAPAVSARDRTEHRLAMLRLATQDNPRFSVHCTEIERQGTSYTVDTLAVFKEQFGSAAELFLLIGADNYAIFSSWRDPDTIMQAARVAVYQRPGVGGPEIVEPFIALEGPVLALSSTWIRAQVAAGKSVRYLVPDAVWHYMLRQNVYRPGSGPERLNEM